MSVAITLNYSEDRIVAVGVSGPQGPQGLQGEVGTAATIAVGTKTTGAAGTSVNVVNSGTSSAAVLDFTIPRGDAGANGDWSTAQTVRNDSSTSATTLASTDAGNLVRFTGGTNITVTLKSGASGVTLATGQRIDVVQTGSGQITFSGGDHTLLSTPTAKLRATNSAASIICLDASSSPAVYLLTGDLAATV